MVRKKNGPEESKETKLARKFLKHKLQKYKTENNQTLEQMGKEVNRSKGHMSKVVEGRSTPSIELFSELALLLKIPLYEVLRPTEAFFKENFAEILHDWMAELQWSLETLQEKTGIPSKRLEQFLSNEVSPNFEERVILMQSLRIPLIYTLEHLLDINRDFLWFSGFDEKRIQFLNNFYRELIEKELALLKTEKSDK